MRIEVGQNLEPMPRHTFHGDLSKLELHLRWGVLNHEIHLRFREPANRILSSTGREVDTFRQVIIIHSKEFVGGEHRSRLD